MSKLDERVGAVRTSLDRQGANYQFVTCDSRYGEVIVAHEGGLIILDQSEDADAISVDPETGSVRCHVRS